MDQTTRTMDKHKETTNDKDQDTNTPGPTTGGMRSMGPQPGEPTLEEKLGVDAQPHSEAPQQHNDDPRRNQGGARQGPPPIEAGSPSKDATAPHPPDNRGSTDADPDNERSGGMSGGLSEDRER